MCKVVLVFQKSSEDDNHHSPFHICGKSTIFIQTLMVLSHLFLP